MRKYSLHLVTVIFLIAGIASCKKETNTTVIPPPVAVNYPPIARAGTDTTISLSSCSAIIRVPLDGTKSSDPENNITNASWRIISGPMGSITITGGNPLYATVEIRREGVYSFELQIVNNHNLTSKDTVTITVIGSSPKEYDLDLTSNTTYIFRDNYLDCNDITSPCFYYDKTEIVGVGNFVPIGVMHVSVFENGDTANLNYGKTSLISVYNDNYITNIFGSTSISFKKLIQQGGGAFTGNFNIRDGSAKFCDDVW